MMEEWNIGKDKRTGRLEYWNVGVLGRSQRKDLF